MELLEVMLKRRSTRSFKDENISRDDLEKILQAGLLAPTSRNRKPCNFMVVENKDVLNQLAESKDHGAALLKGANKAIVVIGDTLIADTWIEDSSIALTYMHLMATELGLGSCWVQIHLRAKDGIDSEGIVRDILKIDNHYGIVGILALGIPQNTPEPHTLEDIDKNKVHFLV